MFVSILQRFGFMASPRAELTLQSRPESPASKDALAAEAIQMRGALDGGADANSSVHPQAASLRRQDVKSTSKTLNGPQAVDNKIEKASKKVITKFVAKVEPKASSKVNTQASAQLPVPEVMSVAARKAAPARTKSSAAEKIILKSSATHADAKLIAVNAALKVEVKAAPSVSAKLTDKKDSDAKFASNAKSIPHPKSQPVSTPAPKASAKTVVKTSPVPAKAVNAALKVTTKPTPKAPSKPATSAAPKSATKLPAQPVGIKAAGNPTPVNLLATTIRHGKAAQALVAEKAVALNARAALSSNGLPPPPPLKPGRRSSSRAHSHLPPPAPMLPTHSPDAAKASYTTISERVIAPPPHVAALKDPKLANNWKTKSAEALSDEEVKAMPDAEYMNDKQLAFFRHKLSVLKQDIHNNAGETTEHLREDTVVVPDPADRATIEEEHALELRTRDRERKLLKKIEQSIGRIDSGDYGYCDETGEPIGVGRLIARPTANLSLEAQQRRELKQKMFGD